MPIERPNGSPFIIGQYRNIPLDPLPVNTLEIKPSMYDNVKSKLAEYLQRPIEIKNKILKHNEKIRHWRK